MPILNCAMHAEEGILRSGVAVETMIKSMSFGSSPAEAIASSPARVARSDVYSSGSAMCRSRIPNVSNTHCGEVGKFATTSSLVRILDGTYEPVDLMQTLSKWLFRLVISPPVPRTEKDRGGEFTTRQPLPSICVFKRLDGANRCCKVADPTGYYHLSWAKCAFVH